MSNRSRHRQRKAEYDDDVATYGPEAWRRWQFRGALCAGWTELVAPPGWVDTCDYRRSPDLHPLGGWRAPAEIEPVKYIPRALVDLLVSHVEGVNHVRDRKGIDDYLLHKTIYCEDWVRRRDELIQAIKAHEEGETPPALPLAPIQEKGK